MTTTALNPFPDYAVMRLAPGQDADTVTVVTPAIAKGRELVRKYVAGVDVPLKAGKTNAALCAVRGDYGTGKTHLLNDVASQLQVAYSSSTSPSILRATCIETDPLTWFRTKIGQRLDELPLYEMALRLYGAAGKTVASKTELTEAAADLLQEDPTRIRDLIRANNLSVDEVSREFERQLGIICKDYDQTVRRVLSRLVSSETEGPARKWISGVTLPSRDAELLGVPASIDSAEQASLVIGAIAAMHKAVGHPFVLLVDELEHFTRYDVAHNSWGNVTWLKRLLEELGNAGALAFVAGHWSAWQTTKDYLDRFPQYAPIDLVQLKPPDVIEIVSALLGRLPQGFAPTHAQVIATITDGSMRRVMSLCNLLFRLTDGFTKKLTEKQIHEAWTSVAQRIPQQQALEQISDLLEPRGFDVKLDRPFHAIPFDLVAERDDGRVILVQAKHSNTQVDHYDTARKFIDKLLKVTTSSPRAVGMFLANGSIDDELLGILRGGSIPSLRWFDLTNRDVIEKIKTEIAAIDRQPANNAYEPAQQPLSITVSELIKRYATTDAIAPESPGQQAMQAELEQKLRELDERRSQEIGELKQRLKKRANETSSPRYDFVRSETEMSPEHSRANYEAMLEEPTLNKKLRYLATPMMFAMISIVLGLVMILERHSFILASDQMTYERLSLAFFLVGILFPIFGLWSLWFRYSQVMDYFEFSRQMIQDLYVRDVPIKSLVSVNATMRLAIDRYGFSRAREAVIEQLRSMSENLKDFPKEAYDYLHEIANDHRSK